MSRNKKDEGKFFTILTFVISLIGALAWTPQIYNYLQSAEIRGKLVGWASQKEVKLSKWLLYEEKTGEARGILYIPRFSLTSLNKDFNVYDIKINVEYPDDDEVYSGRIIPLGQPINIGVADSMGKRTQMLLSIPLKEQVSMLTVVERELKKRFPTSEFSWFDSLGTNVLETETENKEKFEAWAKEIDAAVTAVGD